MSFIYKAVGHLASINPSRFLNAKTGSASIGVYLIGACGHAQAAKDGSDAVEQIGGIIGESMTLALQVGAGGIFVVCVFAAIYLILKAMGGRATWGDVFGPLLVCALVIAFVAWAVTTGQAKVDAIGAAG